MKEDKKSLFKKVDCLRVYVPDLNEGLKFYSEELGLDVIWKTKNAIGLGMADKKTEVVIQNEDEWQEVDVKVESVIDSVERIENAGGEIVRGPFDIKIGKCAVIKDPWGNQYVILDDSKGAFITDEDGNIIGQKRD